MSTINASTVELTEREKELRERIDALVREAKKEKSILSFQEVEEYFDGLNLSDQEVDQAVDALAGQGIEISFRLTTRKNCFWRKKTERMRKTRSSFRRAGIWIPEM